jgi:hypothetical protein
MIREYINAVEKTAITTVKEEHMNASMKNDNFYSLSPEKLTQIWGIGIPVSKIKLEATKQKSVRADAYHSVERQWPKWGRPLHYICISTNKCIIIL